MIRIALPLLLVAASHAQTTIYVDAANGDDAAAGTTPATAVRTITRGLQRTAQAGDVPGSRVMVATGNYSASFGEILPLQVPAGVALIGEADPNAAAQIDGFGPVPTPTLVSVRPGPPDHPTRVVGLRLTDGGRGVQAVPLLQGFVCVERCGIESMATGIDVRGSNELHIEVTGCLLRDCAAGVRAEGVPSISLRESRVIGSTSAGIVIRDVDFAELDAVVDGSDVGLAVFGLTRPVRTSFTGALEDCAVGVKVTAFGAQLAQVALTHATVAGNQTGIELAGGTGASLTLDRSILHENAEDLVGFVGQASASDSFIPSGALGGPGVLIVDPGLANPDAGDYTLRRGALAIDGFNVVTSSEAEDGNLDTIARRDYGAYEYRALRTTDDPILGTTFDLEVDGLPGAYSVGILDETGGAAISIDTLAGRLDLNPVAAQRVARIGIDAATGVGAWSLELPADPTLAGTTWRVQALSRSALSPTGFAFTNSVELRLR